MKLGVYVKYLSMPISSSQIFIRHVVIAIVINEPTIVLDYLKE